MTNTSALIIKRGKMENNVVTPNGPALKIIEVVERLLKLPQDGLLAIHIPGDIFHFVYQVEDADCNVIK